MTILLAILGLALLMVVHEAGHHFAARAFGMRVVKFSIGFGPPLWRYQSKNGGTVYQVALIPFLAYVQIAGMNPLEEVDPDDKGSYANASLIGRVTAIFAGPLANYLFASVLFFAAFVLGGKSMGVTTEVSEVFEKSPALQAGLQPGDKVVAIDGEALTNDTKGWEQLRKTVLANPEKPLEFKVQRGEGEVTLSVTPKKSEKGTGLIGVKPVELRESFPIGEATKSAAIEPAKMVGRMVVGLAGVLSGKTEADVKGPVGILEEVDKAAKKGPEYYFFFLGMLSTWLALFNMFPIPALDGGRLMFLGYEAISRRRANAKIEAMIHAVGLLLLLGLVSVITVGDVGDWLSKKGDDDKAQVSEKKGEAAPPPSAEPAASSTP